MVFVKVRETYDLKTITNKMTVIAIHTPDPSIIKRNWAGLLMNCKFYRPVSADVALACASVMPLDPQGVGTTEGDVAPEDLFNPILYKACTNESFSLLESRILALSERVSVGYGLDTARVNEGAGTTPFDDDFNVYYGLLSDAHGWRKSAPQSGMSMVGLKPYVHEVLANFASQGENVTSPSAGIWSPGSEVDGATADAILPKFVRGNAKPMPRMPTTAFGSVNAESATGFPSNNGNSETKVPYLRTLVGCIVMPPSRLHELFFRMVVEWTIEFSEIRTLSEIAGWNGLASVGENTHFQSYDFSASSESKTITDSEALAAANVDLNKVM